MVYSNALDTNSIRFIAGTLALLSWLSLLLQWTLLCDRLRLATCQTLARFFGYFTILSNTLVAASFTGWFIYPAAQIPDTTTASVFTAICVYIITVAVIFHLFLRKLAVLKGLDRLVNDMLHTWIPIAYVICWQIILPAGLLDYSDIPYFLAFPVLYLVYILALGHKTNHYPYPFVNITELGYTTVLRNAVFITMGFILLSCLLIWWKS